MLARNPASASGNHCCPRLLFPIAPSWNEPSSETWSSGPSILAGRPSRDAVRSPHPRGPRTATPSGLSSSLRTKSPAISGLADHPRERAFRAPLPPKRCAALKRWSSKHWSSKPLVVYTLVVYTLLQGVIHTYLI